MALGAGEPRVGDLDGISPVAHGASTAAASVFLAEGDAPAAAQQGKPSVHMALRDVESRLAHWDIGAKLFFRMSAAVPTRRPPPLHSASWTSSSAHPFPLAAVRTAGRFLPYDAGRGSSVRGALPREGRLRSPRCTCRKPGPETPSPRQAFMGGLGGPRANSRSCRISADQPCMGRLRTPKRKVTVEVSAEILATLRIGRLHLQ